MKTITIEVSLEQLQALEDIITIGTQDAAISYENGSYSEERYNDFLGCIEEPALELFDKLRLAFQQA